MPLTGGVLVTMTGGFIDEHGRALRHASNVMAHRGYHSGVVANTGRFTIDAITNPRSKRADNLYRATNQLVHQRHPDVLVMAGHSLGGVTVIDAAEMVLNEQLVEPTQLHLALIDTPGSHGLWTAKKYLNPLSWRSVVCSEAREAVRYGSEAAGLFKAVGWSMLTQEVRLMEDIITVGEGLALVGGIDLSNPIAEFTEEGVQVIRVDHADDKLVIPQSRVDGTHVLEGTHLTVCYNPEPVVRAVEEQFVLPSHHSTN
jgi:hypothetical protein